MGLGAWLPNRRSPLASTAAPALISPALFLHAPLAGAPWRLPATEGWTLGLICLTFCAVPIAANNEAANEPGQADGLPFEEGLKKLEAIVQAMESEDLPLDTLLARYEEGTRLARICQQKLAAAELKIQKLEQAASGELQLKPMQPPPEASAE